MMRFGEDFDLLCKRERKKNVRQVRSRGGGRARTWTQTNLAVVDQVLVLNVVATSNDEDDRL